MQSEAYTDGPLPIGEGQTISQPFVVAAMTDALGLRPQDRVYELGTGSGYQAAVASRLCAHVYTVEIHPALAERAAKTLAELGYRNVSVRSGDGFRGWPEAAPFDAMLITAAVAELPRELLAQLKKRSPVAPVARLAASGSPAHREVRRWQHDVAQAASRPLRAIDRCAAGAASKTRARSPARRAPCTPLSSR
jgi:protein-L-isoaspartate(D-aspartate) O-methyltransferase